MRVLAAGPEDWAWWMARTDHVPPPNFRAIKAVDGSGRIRGMVGFDRWTESAAYMHVTVDSDKGGTGLGDWLALVRASFDYLFRQAEKVMALSLLRASNTTSLPLARALGFREVFRLKDGWALGEDMLLLQMLASECRWLRRRHDHGR